MPCGARRGCVDAAPCARRDAEALREPSDLPDKPKVRNETGGRPWAASRGAVDVTPDAWASPRRRPALGSVVAVLALVAGLLGSSAATLAPAAAATVTPSVTVSAAQSTSVAPPSWWQGDCDSTRWNKIAASYGWAGPGAHRMGASYLGVPVCGPRPAVDGSPDVQWGRAGWGESEWQCVELAQRFMAQIYGTTAYQANGSQVVSHYSTAYGGGLVRINNGTRGVAPVPGDVVSFTTPNNPWGHVTVVVSTNIDTSGNGTVTMLSQNDSANGWRTLPIVGWRLQGMGSLTPYGWLHDPQGRGNPLGEGQFVEVSGTSTVYRVAGGAPVVVTSWTPFGGPQRVNVVAKAQFDHLKAVPADGTYLKDLSNGQVYRVAGGAPLLVANAEAARLPQWGTAPVIGIDHQALLAHDHLRSVPADGTQLCRVDDGTCYVVAGGAPLAVPAADAAKTPGWAAAKSVVVSSAEFTAYQDLHAYPADGTFVCDAANKACYRIAGGAPMTIGAKDPKVAGFSAASAVKAPHYEFAHWTHLRRYAADGTVLCPVGDSTCYVVAGRAPIAIAPSSNPVIPTRAGVRIARTELVKPVHITARPLDDTVLHSVQTNMTYVVRNGVAHAVPSVPNAGSVAPVMIDQAAVDNAGRAGAWSHLASSPAVVRMSTPVALLTTSRAVALAWPVPVASSAVTTYDVRSRRAFVTGGFTPWQTPAAWQGVKATTLRAPLAMGYDTCFSVRAHNRAGQTGPWSPAWCSARALDDRAATATTRVWSSTSSPALYQRTGSRTTTHKASWSFAGAVVARVGIVASTCPTCGGVSVWVGKTRIGFLSLRSPTVATQQLLALPPFRLTTGTVTISVTSPNGTPVELDGVVLSRT
jgi:CHAP domain